MKIHLIFGLLTCCTASIVAQDATPPPAALTTEQKVEHITAAMAQVQAQMDANQKLLQDLQQQLNTLKLQMAAEKASASQVDATASPSNTASLEEIREHQAIAESQIATHELTKVETESKYPLKITGLVLFNAFVNTKQVDFAASPAYALPGPGSTGLSIRQTVLGLDARGPHLLGASSYADVRVDFFSNSTQAGYASSLLRLRTAHAGLKWADSEVFFSLDRTILSPNAPSSLLAVGQPELAWAGNLWSWNTQLGASRQFHLSEATRLKLQAALIDPGDPRPPRYMSVTSTTGSERSRWPGTEARIAFLSGTGSKGAEIGVGGYFSPHRTIDDARYDAWAITADLRLPVTRHFEFLANAYRGQALGGLGGGGYVDFVYSYSDVAELTRALEDVGGWAQLKAKLGQRVEINSGYGIDNPFAREIRESIAQTGEGSYTGLARNREHFSNVIYSPSAYLLFSVEYRRLWSNPANGPTWLSDIIGIGAGYRF